MAATAHNNRSFTWLTVFILLISIAILSLACDLLAAPARFNNIINVSTGSFIAKVILLPNRLNQGPIWSFFANGLGGTIDGFLNLALLWWAKRTIRFRKLADGLILFVCVVSVARSLIAVVYGWSQDQSPILVLTDSGALNTGSASRNDFTVYGWSSQLLGFDITDSDRYSMEQLRKSVLAMRGLSVSLAVLDAVALGLASHRMHLTRKDYRKFNQSKV